MSGNGDVSVTETAQSDQYLAASHQYYRYYNNKQHHAHNAPPIQQQQQLQQQQLQLQQQLQQLPQQQQLQPQSCLRHIPSSLQWQQQQPQQQQHQLSSNSSAEFDEFHWPSKQNITTATTGGGGGSGKVYITPADIPPPPPHPQHNSNNHSYHSNHSNHNGGNKRLHRATTPGGGGGGDGVTATPTHRCKCDHPIELLGYDEAPPSQPQTTISTTATASAAAADLHRHPPYYYKPAVAVGQQPQHHHQHPHHHQQQQQQQQFHHHQHSRRHSAKLHESMLSVGGISGCGGGGGSSLDDDDLASVGGGGMGTTRFKNLMHSKQKKKKKIRIILYVVLGLVILAGLIVGLVFLLSGDSSETTTSNDAVDLEDILNGHFYAKRFNGSWSSGSNVIFKDSGAIVELDVKTQQRTVLLSNASHYVLYEKSADGQLLLLAKNYKKNFRYSFIAQYDIYNLSTGVITPLTIQDEQRFLLMVQWSPVGNALIINYDRNLYYKPSALEAEIIITSDENTAYLNGIPDWVYEEEVFSSNVATWFNPSGTQIAFIRFDDSPTHIINFPYYGEAGDLRYQYPIHQAIAYPKAGSSNPRVELYVADLEQAVNGNEFLHQMPTASALNTETDYIITVVHWLDNKNVLSIWMNRIQNAAYVYTYDSLARKELYSVESKTGWVDLYTAPFKNLNATKIAFILPHNDYKQIALLSTSVSAEQQQPEFITDDDCVVDSILHWDTTYDVIFYKANTAQNPEVLHLYAVTVSKPKPKCLTCKLITSGDVEQTYFSATFNDNNQIVISSQGPGVPTAHIYEWSYTNSEVSLTKLMDWENNDLLRSKLNKLALPTHQIDTVTIDGGFTAKVLLQLPPNLDRSGNTKYPMLVDVYGGPASYSVTDKWIFDWGTYLSSNQSVIYAKIDGRGSGLRGEELLHAIYLKLGTVEISDQITVTHNLTQKYNFIDSEHVGIWGWSYGGYAAAMALANDDQGVFKCAASIAPVTDWTYYDSIYTERYMGLPLENEVGYENSRLSTKAEKLNNKKYLLVHGTLDDNVHYQQSMILAKSLERNDILFKQISYTDEDHGLSNVRPHLYHSLDRFFGDCFASSRLSKSAK